MTDVESSRAGVDTMTYRDGDIPETDRELDRYLDRQARARAYEALMGPGLLICDECNHHADDHMNAHVTQEPARSFIFDNATCWAENICKKCDPALFDRIPEEVLP